MRHFYGKFVSFLTLLISCGPFMYVTGVKWQNSKHSVHSHFGFDEDCPRSAEPNHNLDHEEITFSSMEKTSPHL